ncbi:MAG: nucleotidyltransferase domain-containing protein [bacterium]|nr:nucleotidyltransferase domain-containing protein [bacterium]
MATLDDSVIRKALSATRVLKQNGTVQAVYIFGSQVDGNTDHWSDIDVAAFMDGVESWDIQRRAVVMARIQREVGYEVEAHLFPATALKQSDAGSFAGYILTHGVCIYPAKTLGGP